MRILVLQDIFPPDYGGGAGVIAFALAREYTMQGHEVLVIATTTDPRRTGETLFEGLRVHRIYSNYPGRWRAWRSVYNRQVIPEFKQVLAAFKPEVVHTHNIHTYLSYAALQAAHRSGARVFLTAHDTMLYAYGKVPDARRASAWQQFSQERFRYNPFRNIFIRHALRQVEKVIAVSNALAEALRNNGIQRVMTIHNGINSAAWNFNENAVTAFKHEYRIGTQAILFGGRLSASKGGGNLLEAFSLLLGDVPDAQLIVMGEKNEYASHMLAQASTTGIAEHITFTGHISGEVLSAAYYAAAVVAVPSLYLDPFPTTNLEAMASGRAVVATCLGGSPEVVEDGVTGRVIDPRSTNTLATALKDLLDDSTTADMLGKAGRTRVTQEFSLTHQAEQYLDLFKSV